MCLQPIPMFCQAFSLLMDNICLLVSKRSPDTSLNDALPLLVQGLRSSTQMPAALNAVSQLSKQSQPLHTLTPGLMELLQQCMESHWSAGSVVSHGLTTALRNSYATKPFVL